MVPFLSIAVYLYKVYTIIQLQSKMILIVRHRALNKEIQVRSNIQRNMFSSIIGLMTEMSYDLTYIWMMIWLIWRNTSHFLIFEMPYDSLFEMIASIYRAWVLNIYMS